MENKIVDDNMNEKVKKKIKQKYKERIIQKSITIIVIFALIILLTFILLTKNKPNGIKFYENGKVDYTVSLAKNDFFENNTLTANNQYIASIIDSINLNFNYNLQMKENYKDYKYKYRIETQTRVIEKSTQNDIYNFKDVLKSEELVDPNSDKFAISSSVTIDYQKYNAMIKKIVSTFNLNNVECKTIATLYVDLLDKDEKVKNTAKIDVKIPLNVKTVNVDVENNLDGTEEKNFTENDNKFNLWTIIVLIIILAIVEFIITKQLVEEIKSNCSEEVINDIKFKRILREYRSYIQKVSSNFNFSKYDMIKVENFEDLLKISEIIQNPVLMIENETKTKTYFVVTSNNNALYTYEINHGNVKELGK